MLATLAAPPSGEGWATEWKFDGQRATVVVEDDEVRVFSRNGADVSLTFPELAHVGAAVGHRRVVLDGEIVALDERGRPSFTRLQRRWPQQRRPGAELLREVPVWLLAFDLLRVDGRDVTGEPYVRRRELLDAVMVIAKSPVLTVPGSIAGVQPAELLEVAAAHGVEGIVCKRLDSPYRPGRSALWLKSPVRATCELLIAGYWCAGGPGGRSSVGSMLLAGHDSAGDLVAVGEVGTGLSACTRRRLHSMLSVITQESSPVVNRVEARGVLWVRPQVVCEVAYREYVAGRWLRHTSFKGLRHVDSVHVPLPPCSAG